MATLKEKMDKYIGIQGTITLNKTLNVLVRVVDYKESYGVPRWLVTPISGTGQAWIEQEPVEKD